MPARQPETLSSLSAFNWARLRRAGGIAAFIFLGYSLVTMLQMRRRATESCK